MALTRTIPSQLAGEIFPAHSLPPALGHQFSFTVCCRSHNSASASPDAVNKLK